MYALLVTPVRSPKKSRLVASRATPLSDEEAGRAPDLVPVRAKAIVPHQTAQPRNQAATIRASSGLSSHAQRVAANRG